MPDKISLIIPTIAPGTDGEAVANLQRALHRLLQERYFIIRESPDHPAQDEIDMFSQLLAEEQQSAYYGKGTHRLVFLFQLQEGLGENLRDIGVEEETAKRLNRWLKDLGAFDEEPVDLEFVVYGVVRGADNAPLPGVEVQAFDKDLRVDQPLGKISVTTKNGEFRIPYSTDDFKRAEKRGARLPNLMVRAVQISEAGRNVREIIVPNPTGQDNINIVLDTLTEWELHTQTIMPLLEGQGEKDSDLHPSQLTDTDLTFIVKETGFARETCEWWVLGFQAVSTSVRVSESMGDMSAVLYGWFRLGLPTDLQRLWDVESERLVSSYRTAVEQRIIPQVVDERILREWITNNRHQTILDAPTPGTATPLRAILEPLGLDEAQQRVIASAVPNLQLNDGNLVEQIEGLPGFNGNAVAVAHTLRLGALTGGNVEVMNALRPLLDSEATGVLSPLVHVPRREWLKVAYETSGVSAPTDYALALEETIERLYPTETLVAHIEQGRLGSSNSALERAANFLIEHPEFDITTANIRDDFSDQPAEVIEALLGFQRTKTLGARWTEGKVLIESGLGSARAMVAAGREKVHQRVGRWIAKEKIDSLFTMAEVLDAQALGVVQLLDERSSPNSIKLFKSAVWNEDQQNIIRGSATLQTLFGAQEMCACGHCRSVYSPSAYFVDLLQFLWNSEGHRAFDALVRRRPDVLDLELSCKNSNHEMPQIDLVLEQLEHALAFPIPFSESDVDLIHTQLEQQTFTRLRPYLDRTAINIADSTLEAIISPEQIGNRGTITWVVTDTYRRWGLNISRGLLTVFGYDGIQRPDISPTQSLLAALKSGDLSGEQDFLRKMADIAQISAPFEVVGYVVKKDDYEPQWHITLTYALRVSIDPAGEIITFVNETGMPLPEQLGYPSGAIWEIVQDFQQNYVSEVFTNLLSAPMAQPEFIELTQIDPVNVDNSLLPEDTSLWQLLLDALPITIEYIAPGGGLTGLAFQSGNPDMDLALGSEHQIPEAYTRLQNQPFPWTLPLDLPLEELRALLARLEIDRVALIDLFQTGAEIAYETLGLSAAQAKSIQTPVGQEGELARIWGLTWDGVHYSAQDASTAETVSEATVVGVLNRVSLLLQQARLTFAELEVILDTAWVSGGDPLDILPRLECIPSKMGVEDLQLRHLDRIHRFVRAWRVLGWPISDVDRALQIAQAYQKNGDPLIDFIRNLAALKQLRDTFSIPLEILAPNDKARLQIALNLETADYEFLCQMLTIPNKTSDPFPSLMDIVRLCQEHQRILKMGLSVEELSYLLLGQTRAGSDIWVGEPQIAAALDALRAILTSSSSLAPETNRQEARVSFGKTWFRQQFSNLSETQIDNILIGTAPQKPLDAFYAEAFLTVDPTRLLEKKADFAALFTLVQTLDRLNQNSAKPLITPVIDLTDNQTVTKLKQVRLAILGSPVVRAEAAEQDALIDWCGEHFKLAPLMTAQALKTPMDGSALSRLFLDAKFLTSSTQTMITRSNFPEIFKAYNRLYTLSLVAAKVKLTDLDFVWMPITGSATSMTGLDIFRLPLTAASLASGDLFKLWDSFATLLQLRKRIPKFTALITAYLKPSVTDPRESIGINALAAGFGLNVTEVTATGIQVGIIANTITRDTRLLSRWLTLLVLIKKTGISTANLADLAAITVSIETLAIIDKRLQARYTTAHWRHLKSPIADAMRIRRRDTLIDALLHRDKLVDSNALYERLLIDSKVEPMLRTTRILQATNAVQLFVFRCLLNEERDVGIKPSFINRDQWSWMKNYRVWEANRKIFLYPENWLIPDLRDDKTQIFREMESALAQGELRQEEAIGALQRYLANFAEQMQMKVSGLYLDEGQRAAPQPNNLPPPPEMSRRVLYVVGRLPNPPYTYFWRMCKNFGQDGMVWTGWEKLDLDIASEHVIPFVLNEAFHIAWPVIRKAHQDAITDPQDPQKVVNPGGDYWDVQMAWSRLIDGRWSKRLITRDTFAPPPMKGVTEYVKQAMVLSNKNERSSFAFRLSRDTKYIDLISPPIAFETVKIEAYSAYETAEDEWPNIAPKYTPAGITRVDLTVQVLGKDPTGKKGQLAGVEVYWFVNAVAIPIPHPFGSTDANGQYKTSGSSVLTDKLQLEVSAKWTSGGNIQYIKSPTILEIKPFFHNTLYAQIVIDVLYTLPKDASRSVDMYHVATVSLDATSDSNIVSFSKPGSLLKPLTNTEFSENSFRERGEGPLALGMGGRLLKFERTPGLFTLNQANLPMPSVPVPVPMPPSSNQLDVWHYADDGASYFIELLGQPGPLPPGRTATPPLVLADTHPYVSILMALAQLHPFQMFRPDVQTLSDSRKVNGDVGGAAYYDRTQQLSGPLTVQGITFDSRAPLGIYHWELFYHAPLIIADLLRQQQRFEEAQRWLQTIFDPTTDDSGPETERYWRCRPLREAGRGDTITQLLEWLAHNPKNTNNQIVNSIANWRDNPFSPFTIARMRHSAFQWKAVLAYLDNLMAWADSLFRQDTRESINEATQLYVLAAMILGPRPLAVPERGAPPAMSYRELRGTDEKSIDAFSNRWVSVADLPSVRAEVSNPLRPSPFVKRRVEATDPGKPSLETIGTLYFCIPANEKLLTYWARVEDRLFNIRHSQTIDGVPRSLSLYESPIDPEFLIRARAAGLDLARVLAMRSAALPHHRFAVWYQKALELTGELKSLGSALLSALEKHDGEDLALLRSGHEIELLSLVQEIKKKQLEDAKAQRDVLLASRQTAQEKLAHYQKLLGKTDLKVPPLHAPIPTESASLPLAGGGSDTQGLALISGEQNQLEMMSQAQSMGFMSSAINLASTVLYALNAFKAMGSGVEAGPGHAMSAFAAAYRIGADQASSEGQRSATIAGYQRRRFDNTMQINMASKEIEQLDKQLLAADIRIAIAEREQKNHTRQMEHAHEVNEFMRDKFTNKELYSWMGDSLMSVFSQVYQLALDAARAAEQACRHELGLPEASARFVTASAWDSRKKGLLAGEKLYLDLKRMELSYHELHARELEITKHVSLLQLDPLALLRLKLEGQCEIELPEWLFDMDHPGHYMRRIKTVSLSIPSVTGPYTSVNCTLTLLKGTIRMEKTFSEGYAKKTTSDDIRFMESSGAAQSIVTSSGQNDSGLFEVNLRDERYLPFEGAGVISTWRLELPKDFRQFDYGTISDVILHIRYTARDGGDQFRDKAIGAVKALFPDPAATSSVPLMRLFSLRYEFPTEWAKFKAATAPASLTLTLRSEHFPYWTQDAKKTATELHWYNHVQADKVLPDPIPLSEPTLPQSFASQQITLSKKAPDVNDDVLNNTTDDVWLLLIYTISQK
jgi:hypothetical protein